MPPAPPLEAPYDFARFEGGLAVDGTGKIYTTATAGRTSGVRRFFTLQYDPFTGVQKTVTDNIPFSCQCGLELDNNGRLLLGSVPIDVNDFSAGRHIVSIDTNNGDHEIITSFPNEGTGRFDVVNDAGDIVIRTAVAGIGLTEKIWHHERATGLNKILYEGSPFHVSDAEYGAIADIVRTGDGTFYLIDDQTADIPTPVPTPGSLGKIVVEGDINGGELQDVWVDFTGNWSAGDIDNNNQLYIASPFGFVVSVDLDLAPIINDGLVFEQADGAELFFRDSDVGLDLFLTDLEVFHQASPVPLPGAIWCFLSAFGFLSLSRRQKT